ncbi:MAG: hypothetical protein K2X77_13220 [Candidatus Obscuribacterales bacterium]|nr:hypothetical protein [Candidatus Obscuribacterales bacterium]
MHLNELSALTKRIKSEIFEWAHNESVHTQRAVGKTSRIAQTNLNVGTNFLSSFDLSTPEWQYDKIFETQTDSLHFRWIRINGIRLFVGSSICEGDANQSLEGPVYVDLENAAKGDKNIELTPGLVAWMLAGGIWVVPHLPWQYPEDVEHTLACALDRIEYLDNGYKCAIAPKIFVGAAEGLINLALGLASENRNIDTIFLKNGTYDVDSLNPSEIQNISNLFYLVDSEHAKEVYGIGVQNNHFLSVFYENKISILDHKESLAFALKRSLH